MVFITYEHLHVLAWYWILYLLPQLGHRSLVNMQQLISSLSNLSSLSYESCQLQKHIFSSVVQLALSPFALHNFDIWGSTRVKSNFGFQYFITFITDYSRYTWLFLMENYSQLFSTFQSFYNEIKNQFGVSILTLHNENV